MSNNLELDLGQGSVYAESEEVVNGGGPSAGSTIHRQGFSLNAVRACKLVKGGTSRQTITCTLASTDYAITNPLASALSRYVRVWSDSDFLLAMGETTATYGVLVKGGAPETFPVTYTGVAADDRVHVQSATAGATVYVAEMRD